jgi:IclR family acetate operon transcriptional repressor
MAALVGKTTSVEAATEDGLKAGVPELRRAAARLAELLEATVF